MDPLATSFHKPFLHSGQSWASSGHTKVGTVSGLTRHVYPCGCTTAGNGTPAEPITILYCAVHNTAHKTRNVLGDLLNYLPNAINETLNGRKAFEAARNQFGNITSSPASPIAKS